MTVDTEMQRITPSNVTQDLEKLKTIREERENLSSSAIQTIKSTPTTYGLNQLRDNYFKLGERRTIEILRKQKLTPLTKKEQEQLNVYKKFLNLHEKINNLTIKEEDLLTNPEVRSMDEGYDLV